MFSGKEGFLESFDFHLYFSLEPGKTSFSQKRRRFDFEGFKGHANEFEK